MTVCSANFARCHFCVYVSIKLCVQLQPRSQSIQFIKPINLPRVVSLQSTNDIDKYRKFKRKQCQFLSDDNAKKLTPLTNCRLRHITRVRVYYNERSRDKIECHRVEEKNSKKKKPIQLQYVENVQFPISLCASLNDKIFAMCLCWPFQTGTERQYQSTFNAVSSNCYILLISILAHCVYCEN